MEVFVFDTSPAPSKKILSPRFAFDVFTSLANHHAYNAWIAQASASLSPVRVHPKTNTSKMEVFVFIQNNHFQNGSVCFPNPQDRS